MPTRPAGIYLFYLPLSKISLNAAFGENLLPSVPMYYVFILSLTTAIIHRLGDQC